MQHDHTPGTGQIGLSTEDLAAPQRPPAEDTPQPPPKSTALGDSTPEATAQTSAHGSTADDEESAPQLLSADQSQDFQARWQDIQNGFVDSPRDSVHAADALVAKLMQTLAQTFTEHKHSLEEQWNRGEQVDTEGLRKALRQYRSFFNRLLVE
ncbi:hypothetical protein ACFU90_04050 [Streptomyces noursei]|uniref:hypothetical protein n=1 Tax=Streptomyces noursei TaxID=1971 RepID=UPI0005CAE2BF|nr:hypothetical protein [Streptomyces noursei]MCZ0975646.1 hypothetical protein [Streptomyces noursei]